MRLIILILILSISLVSCVKHYTIATYTRKIDDGKKGITVKEKTEKWSGGCCGCSGIEHVRTVNKKLELKYTFECECGAVYKYTAFRVRKTSPEGISKLYNYELVDTPLNTVSEPTIFNFIDDSTFNRIKDVADSICYKIGDIALSKYRLQSIKTVKPTNHKFSEVTDSIFWFSKDVQENNKYVRKYFVADTVIVRENRRTDKVFAPFWSVIGMSERL